MKASLTIPPPVITLNGALLKTNVHAWRLHVQRPIWAVIKSNGYGWGLPRLVSLLDNEIAGYGVADHAEFEAVRKLSSRPILIFSQPPLDRIGSIAQRGGHPTICSLSALEQVILDGKACGRPLRVRLGLAPALGWFGIPLAELQQFVRLARSRWLEVELWSHLTTPEAEAQERHDFAQFIEVFRQAKVPIAAIDLENSAAAARHPLEGERARIGIGLFGVYGSRVPGLRGAIDVSATLITQELADAKLRIGYARRPSPAAGQLLTFRLGYGDGFPRGLTGAILPIGTIVNIGMQYTVIHQSASHVQPEMSFLTADTDLHVLSLPLHISAHETILSLGRMNSTE